MIVFMNDVKCLFLDPNKVYKYLDIKITDINLFAKRKKDLSQAIFFYWIDWLDKHLGRLRSQFVYSTSDEFTKMCKKILN